MALGSAQLDGSTAKITCKRNMAQMALWSHSPAIFAHGPKAAVWLQWFLHTQGNTRMRKLWHPTKNFHEI
jgi:hypothetical protein